jgi:uncharacterized membrane protein
MLVLLLPMSGCSNADPGRSNPEAGPPGPCPTNAIECPDSGPVPTYTQDVLPILEAHCVVCHGAGGVKQDVPLTPYSNFVKRTGTSLRAQTAISKVLNCEMPPPPEPRVSEVERETLVCWYARGRAQ